MNSQQYGAFVTIVTGTALVAMLFAMHTADGDRFGQFSAVATLGMAWLAGNLAALELHVAYIIAMSAALALALLTAFFTL